MNIINQFFLKLALAPTRLYIRLGANPVQVQAILVAKLTMDDRRPNTVQQLNNKKSSKPASAATLGVMAVSVLLGLVYLISFSLGDDRITQLTFYFSFFFFMLAASLLADFTDVLIDVRDNYIILPKPVSDKTFVTARILHIFIHLCKLVLPMALPGLIFLIYKDGVWGSLCFLLIVLLLTVFVIFFINALYILILRITTPARFQSIIGSVQIVFAILLYASYQVLPRMIKSLGDFTLDVHQKPLLLAVPSYWFAAGYNTLHTFSANSWNIVATLFGLLIPFISLYAVIKYLAPSFNNKLALINSIDVTEKKGPVTHKKRALLVVMLPCLAGCLRKKDRSVWAFFLPGK